MYKTFGIGSGLFAAQFAWVAYNISVPINLLMAALGLALIPLAAQRLFYESWWLNKRYVYNQSPFCPLHKTAGQVRQGWARARLEFYSGRSMR